MGNFPNGKIKRADLQIRYRIPRYASHVPAWGG